MSFTLPDLPYKYDALAPYMSRETLEYHHDKHHLAYVNNANNLIKGTEWEGKSLEDVVKGAFGKNAGLYNNAGQHYNPLHFWQWMKPNGGGDKIPGNLEKKIIADLGSVAKMKEDFVQAGVTQFGSGWAWLTVKDGKIIITKTANGENPLVHGGKPILGVDVWEHSYYIDYRNRRPVNLYYYGGGFDMLATLAAKVLPFTLFETRRLVGAAVGILGLFVTWRLGRRLGGPFAGLIALVLLATCPVYYGHMFMNPKDSPF